MPSKEAELLAAEYVMLLSKPTPQTPPRKKMLEHLLRQMVQHLGTVKAASELIEATKQSMALLLPKEGSLDLIDP